ncbi:MULTISPECIES: type I-E CRISPR-associated protein Cas6/Cse3/CasE [Thiorhodovibrio]|uniref:type I-E CRISPR-associated protein Cas6/Cse3/CasE n=1 Tax=Thiorhodovibrio TaxID=61593 RepID=UPI00191413C0|nr:MULTISPECIES: type I-E CRISPR-associated protein Cas6/Cse3/CasE [Thiorhodovibrio]MBK5969332.1 type I-E CRISPR-associated protein Cas6/Cse3/CasE [Thiorhodovibrio winogradskyi]WPL13669.1 CRISPR-associated protein Cas6/Cse3/CasE [Thiorhodovibrio litoralis]
MTLSLLHCAPDEQTLATWATRHRLLSPDGDFGYALHALLTAAFGDLSPQPFCYLGARQGLLAYTNQPPEQLRDHAALATPDVAQALGLDHLATRNFPSAWRPGQVLNFEVRARPVRRTKDGRERDVFLHAVDAQPAALGLDRESIYAQWMGQQLAAQQAAELMQIGMTAFRLSRVMRRTGPDAEGRRKSRAFSGPDAMFKGQLRIGDGEAFTRLLTRGIGRHRAFGFGMLLLKPAHSC